MPDRCAACDHLLPCTACPDDHRRPGEAGLSPDFCDSVCQRAWHQAKTSDGYEPWGRDAATVSLAGDADQRDVALTDTAADRVTHHGGERLEDLAAQLVDMVAAQLAADFRVELWRNVRPGSPAVRVVVVCGHDDCDAHVPYDIPGGVRTPTTAAMLAVQVLSHIGHHVLEQHPRARPVGERIPVYRLFGRWSDRGPLGLALGTLWSLSATRDDVRCAVVFRGECEACQMAGDSTPATITVDRALVRASTLEDLAGLVAARLEAHHDPRHGRHARYQRAHLYADAGPDVLEAASASSARAIADLEYVRAAAVTPRSVARIEPHGH